MDVVFIGEDIIKSKGGVVTVMKNILHSKHLLNKVTFHPIYTTIEGSPLIKKITLWIHGYFKFLLYLLKFKLIHIHHSIDFNFWMTAFFLFTAKIFNKRVILHNHAADFQKFFNSQPLLLQKVIKKTFEKADVNIILSNSWYNWYNSIAPNANWFLLHNAISIPSEKIKNTIKRNNISLVFLGRLEQRKGIFDILSIMPEIIKNNPNVVLKLAGQGNIAEIKNIISKLKIDNSVELLGYLNKTDIDKLFSESDIFLLPSYDEGLPMALLEAMAHGIAPVSCPVGGIPDVIENNVDGLLVDAGNKSMLLNAVNRLITDENLRNTISVNAAKKIKTHFSINYYSQKLFELYNNLA
ncbi:MAG: glycosyltransferase family 4 protein [Bacteroidales bacterium]|nr:glycosyltransferase family 4 protein [Bacteroidales bacterium]